MIICKLNYCNMLVIKIIILGDEFFFTTIKKKSKKEI